MKVSLRDNFKCISVLLNASIGCIHPHTKVLVDLLCLKVNQDYNLIELRISIMFQPQASIIADS
ncbi:MAG: hypothetical protein ACK571_08340, partial [Pseudanabaena sp.]